MLNRFKDTKKLGHGKALAYWPVSNCAIKGWRKVSCVRHKDKRTTLTTQHIQQQAAIANHTCINSVKCK